MYPESTFGQASPPGRWDPGPSVESAPVDERPIGIFDSGAGGLTVLHECLVTMPHEDFVYLGDGARCPYGPRPAAEIRRCALEVASYLEGLGVKLIVAACNSATAAALPTLQERLAVPVVGVLAPEARAAVQATRNRRIGPARDRGDRLEPPLHARRPRARRRRVRDFEVACPKLVPADRGRPGGRPAPRRRGPGVRGAAEERRGGHRHPRLHALPARAATCSSAPSGATSRSSSRPRRRHGRSRRRSRARVSRTLPERDGSCRFLTTGSAGRVPRARRALPAASDRPGRDRRGRRSSSGQPRDRPALLGFREGPPRASTRYERIASRPRPLRTKRARKRHSQRPDLRGGRLPPGAD